MHPRKDSLVAAKNKGKRAIAAPHVGVGLTCCQLYRKAWQRILSATAAGYYLEAVTLLESILTDRLESRASYLTGQNKGYQNLGPLVRTLQEHEVVAEFRPIIKEIDAWRKRRNQAVHEVVKFQAAEHPTWEEKVEPSATHHARRKAGSARFRRGRQAQASKEWCAPRSD